ncbi:MAG: hypothetical protein WKF96_01635 [Solirubrobacteraceae bacterium]
MPTLTKAAVVFAAAGSSGGVPVWIPIAALVAGAFALITLAINRYIDRRDRRRSLYADAYKAALAWVEMLYRVRRRDPDNPYPVADQFHKLQEDIDFHQAWICTESQALGRAYERLVLTVKALTAEDIKRAWIDPPCKPEDSFSLAMETHPPVAEAKRQFMGDLQDHLSLNPERRWALNERYDDHNWNQIKASLPGAAATTGGTP